MELHQARVRLPTVDACSNQRSQEEAFAPETVLPLTAGGTGGGPGPSGIGSLAGRTDAAEKFIEWLPSHAAPRAGDPVRNSSHKIPPAATSTAVRDMVISSD